MSDQGAVYIKEEMGYSKYIFGLFFLNIDNKLDLIVIVFN